MSLDKNKHKEEATKTRIDNFFKDSIIYSSDRVYKKGEIKMYGWKSTGGSKYLRRAGSNQ